jgi:hypothetical protein
MTYLNCDHYSLSRPAAVDLSHRRENLGSGWPVRTDETKYRLAIALPAIDGGMEKS